MLQGKPNLNALFRRKKQQDCYESRNRVETQQHTTGGGSMILKTPGSKILKIHGLRESLNFVLGV